MQHLLVLTDDGHEVHRHNASRAVFQHLLHRLQRARGVLSVFAHLLQIAREHVEHIDGVIVVLFVHVLFLGFHVVLHILHKTLRELGEVVDVVQRVQNAVDESLCELTGSCHFFESHHFGRAFFHKFLQSCVLVSQPAQSQLEECTEEQSEQQQIQDNHVPPVVERRVDVELNARDVGDVVQRHSGLYGEGVVAVCEVHEGCRRVGAPTAPAAVVQSVAVEGLEGNGRQVERERNLQAVILMSQSGQHLRHLAESTPEDAVVAQPHRAYV